MAGLSADRPSEVVLAARVARQFYIEGVSKVDIADRLGISRFRVARLLDSARETGMVRIEIGLPGGSLDASLSAELCSALGLKHAFVFNFPDDDEPALRRRLGEAAGQTLMDLISPGDVLGMAWSRTLSGLTAALTQMPPCPIVQLTGAVPPPDGRDLLEVVRGVARVGGGIRFRRLRRRGIRLFGRGHRLRIRRHGRQAETGRQHQQPRQAVSRSGSHYLARLPACARWVHISAKLWRGFTAKLKLVMPALVAGIHVFLLSELRRGWPEQGSHPPKTALRHPADLWRG